MMFLRSRRTMTAVAAASSLVLSATAVPNSPFSPPQAAAQATTANKTQDTNLDYRCNVYAAGGLGNQNYDLSTGFHVTMPERVDAGEVVDVTVNIDSIQVREEQAGKVGGQPSFEEGGTIGNRIRFHIPEDVELVGSNLNATLNNHVLDVTGMMQPSKDGSLVTIAFKELKLQLKPKKQGTVTLQTPKKFPKLDEDGRVVHSNMVWGQGIVGKVFWKTPGLRVTCMTDQYKPLGVTQVGEAADFNEPNYGPIKVKQTDTATSTNSADAPEGTAYAKGANAPEWATVAEDGTVTVKPGLDVEPGDYEVPVVVTYSDSSTDNTVVNVTVKEKEKSLAEQHDPQFGEATVEQEGTATIPVPEGLPEGAKVARGEGAPEWVTVNEDGSIEAKPTLETEVKDYTVPVVVTYDDGSTDEANAKVTVTKKPDNQIYSPEFGSITVQANRSAKTPAIEGLPEGTKFALAEGAPEWATVNPDGTVTLKPSKDVEPGEYNIPVVVTYPDGSTATVELKVNVKKQENPSGSSGSSNGSSSSSGVTGSSPLGKFFAALFGTIAIGAGLFGLYNWARAHGYVR